MAEKESHLDTLTKAITYPFSNTTALLIGGLAVIASAFIVGVPLAYGYIIKAMRGVIRGEDNAPGFDDAGEIYVDGIKAFLVIIPYFVVIFLVIGIMMVGMFATLSLSSSSDDTIATIGAFASFVFMGIMYLIIILISLIIGLAFYASFLLLADTGDLGYSINPLNAFSLIMKRPVDYAIAYLSSMVVSMIGAFACIFIITIPWAIFYIYSSMSYIYGKYYRRTQDIVLEPPA